VLKNAPLATTTVLEAPSVQQKAEVEEQKDVTDLEADPNMALPETTEKDEQEEAPATKPGEKSCWCFPLLEPDSTLLRPFNYDSQKVPDKFEFSVSMRFN
jgi:hypothetical protein